MSEQSERDDDLSSDATGTPIEQDSGESETEQEGGFFDLEADESDGSEEDEDDDENEADDDCDHHSEHYSFPQFSRLPPELRAMIWEAVDPDLKSKARVLDFKIVDGRGNENFAIWETATLAHQTAPARALLAAHRESRRIALAHYPDAMEFRQGRGLVRFNSANDIIFLSLPYNLAVIDLGSLGHFNIKHFAFGDALYSFPDLVNLPQGIETIFYCFDASSLGHRRLDWTVSGSSKQFYHETFEESPYSGEDIKTLYCWPDTTLHTDFLDQVGSDYMTKFPKLPEIGSIPVWPMVQYIFNDDLALYQKTKRYYERNVDRDNRSASPFESSEGESFYESEPDEYALDGFVVDSSSEASEEISDDDNDDRNINGPHGSSDHGDSVDIDEYEEDVPSEQDLDNFNGFSPLQDPSDDEANGNSVNVTSVAHNVESYEDHISDAPSFEEQPRAAKQSSRRKRRIVSSDDESDGDDSVVPPVEIRSRATKRPRLVVSDSDSDEGEDKNDGTEEEEEEEEEEKEKIEESRTSKPVSLLARLRQFRSDVPVSPEGESPTSGEEYDDERYEDEAERGFPDAEFPESAEEEDDQDGW